MKLKPLQTLSLILVVFMATPVLAMECMGELDHAGLYEWSQRASESIEAAENAKQSLNVANINSEVVQPQIVDSEHKMLCSDSSFLKPLGSIRLSKDAEHKGTSFNISRCYVMTALHTVSTITPSNCNDAHSAKKMEDLFGSREIGVASNSSLQPGGFTGRFSTHSSGVRVVAVGNQMGGCGEHVDWAILKRSDPVPADHVLKMEHNLNFEKENDRLAIQARNGRVAREANRMPAPEVEMPRDKYRVVGFPVLGTNNHPRYAKTTLFVPYAARAVPYSFDEKMISARTNAIPGGSGSPLVNTDTGRAIGVLVSNGPGIVSTSSIVDQLKLQIKESKSANSEFRLHPAAENSIRKEGDALLSVLLGSDDELDSSGRCR